MRKIIGVTVPPLSLTWSNLILESPKQNIPLFLQMLDKLPPKKCYKILRTRSADSDPSIPCITNVGNIWESLLIAYTRLETPRPFDLNKLLLPILSNLTSSQRQALVWAPESTSRFFLSKFWNFELGRLLAPDKDHSTAFWEFIFDDLFPSLFYNMDPSAQDTTMTLLSNAITDVKPELVFDRLTSPTALKTSLFSEFMLKGATGFLLSMCQRFTPEMLNDLKTKIAEDSIPTPLRDLFFELLNTTKATSSKRKKYILSVQQYVQDSTNLTDFYLYCDLITHSLARDYLELSLPVSTFKKFLDSCKKPTAQPRFTLSDVISGTSPQKSNDAYISAYTRCYDAKTDKIKDEKTAEEADKKEALARAQKDAEALKKQQEAAREAAREKAREEAREKAREEARAKEKAEELAKADATARTLEKKMYAKLELLSQVLAPFNAQRTELGLLRHQLFGLAPKNPVLANYDAKFAEIWNFDKDPRFNILTFNDHHLRALIKSFSNANWPQMLRSEIDSIFKSLTFRPTRTTAAVSAPRHPLAGDRAGASAGSGGAGGPARTTTSASAPIPPRAGGGSASAADEHAVSAAMFTMGEFQETRSISYILGEMVSHSKYVGFSFSPSASPADCTPDFCNISLECINFLNVLISHYTSLADFNSRNLFSRLRGSIVHHPNQFFKTPQNLLKIHQFLFSNSNPTSFKQEDITNIINTYCFRVHSEDHIFHYLSCLFDFVITHDSSDKSDLVKCLFPIAIFIQFSRAMKKKPLPDSLHPPLQRAILRFQKLPLARLDRNEILHLGMDSLSSIPKYISLMQECVATRK